MAIEQKWPAVSPRLFTANGDAYGNIQVADTRGFKVKQAVTISATGQPNLFVQVKRVIGPTKMVVGPIANVAGKESLQSRSDLSAYTVAAGAFVFAEEQVKAKIKAEDIIQAVYRQEPGTTIGVELDDEFGNPWNSDNPIPTAPVGSAADKDWDDLVLTRNPVTKDITTATYKKNGVVVRVLTLSYDSDEDLIEIVKS